LVARTPDQPPSTAKSRRRRAELLAAAQQAFEERGYVDTGVSDIVRVAGGSRASFYSYFTSKDDALSVLVSELTDDLFVAATHPVELRATTFDNLSASIRQFMHAYRDRAPLLLVLDQATTVNAAFMELRLAIRARFAASLETALLQRRQRRPDPDGLDPRLTAIALGGMVEDLARGRYLFGQNVDDEQAVETLAVLWARGIGNSRGAARRGLVPHWRRR
jgi:AcrR family transcriptional regulator